jgi:Flp pilus assembly protein TadG
MKTSLRSRPSHREQGVAAVEMAIVLPILILLLTTLVFFARVFWYYSVMQKAAHDTARVLSTANQIEIRAAGVPMLAVARSIVEAETAILNPVADDLAIDVQCNFATCGFAVPATVRVVIQMRMRDQIFGPITSAFYGDDGMVLTADVTMRYAGN